MALHWLHKRSLAGVASPMPQCAMDGTRPIELVFAAIELARVVPSSRKARTAAPTRAEVEGVGLILARRLPDRFDHRVMLYIQRGQLRVVDDR